MSKKPLMHTCNHNCVEQLSEKLTLLSRVDQYIKYAKRAKHEKCARLWEHIKKDEQYHAELLKQHLMAEAAGPG